MKQLLTALFETVPGRLSVVYGLLFAYARLWRATLDFPAIHWTMFVVGAGFLAGLVAMAIALTGARGKPRQGPRIDRLYRALPALIGSAGLLVIVVMFPGPFCRVWFSGFLIAVPMPVAYLVAKAMLDAWVRRGRGTDGVVPSAAPKIT